MTDTNLFNELMQLQSRLGNINQSEGESESQYDDDEGGDDDGDVLEEQQDITDLVGALGVFLANTYSVYHEAHGFHWNVKGPDFAQYHALFSGIYEDLIESVDAIAENILKLGYDSPFRMSDMMAMTTIPESENYDDDEEEDTPLDMAVDLLASVSALEGEAKELFELANDADEQGVANFVAERIDALQKTMWQLRASANMQKPAMIKKKIVRISLGNE